MQVRVKVTTFWNYISCFAGNYTKHVFYQVHSHWNLEFLVMQTLSITPLLQQSGAFMLYYSTTHIHQE
jgi:hypothetical protein